MIGTGDQSCWLAKACNLLLLLLLLTGPYYSETASLTDCQLNISRHKYEAAACHKHCVHEQLREDACQAVTGHCHAMPLASPSTAVLTVRRDAAESNILQAKHHEEARDVSEHWVLQRQLQTW